MKVYYWAALFCLLLVAYSQALPEKLVNQNFIGQYRSKQNTNLFSYLDATRGTIEMVFIHQHNDSFLGPNIPNQLEFQLYNPKYHDGKSIQVVIDLSEFNQGAEEGWWQENVEISIEKYNKESFVGKYSCNATYQVIIKTSDENNSPKSIRVLLSLMSNETSAECAFNFYTQLSYYNDKIIIILYSSFVSFTILLQLGLSYWMIKKHSNGLLVPSKISLATITMCTIQDFYLAMTHVYFIMLEDYYMYFILPIFLLVLQSMFFDMKLVFVVWRAVNMTMVMTTAELRKKLTMFYVKFYLTLFIYLTVMYFFHFEVWVLIIQPFLVYMPQIVKNVKKGNNPHFYKSYIFGVLGLRMVLVLYYKGCPQNIYMMTPSLTFCILWVLAFVVQIAILYIQYKKGPRFFIPKRCLPGYYNYYFTYVPLQNQDIPDCSICLQSITASVEQQQSKLVINTSLLSSLLSKPKTVPVMKTPCLHLFHQSCLKAWIDMKMECPTCRSSIPPLY